MRVKIAAQRKVGASYFRMILEGPELEREWQPGQFFMIRIGQGQDPLLRRPFSIHRMGEGRLEILYEVVGRATSLLSSLEPGQELDLLGPLGKGFSMEEGGGRERRLLVAGGMGVAPLLGLAEGLRPAGGGGSRIVVLLGAKTREDLLCAEEFRNLGAEVRVSTEDGSCGRRGLATDLLEGLLAESSAEDPPSILYACGPRGMLARVAGMASGAGLPCQVSLEEYMACGIGACMGCAVRIVGQEDSYRMVCKDGPVFDAREVQW